MKMKMKTSILDIPFTNSPVSKVSEITTQFQLVDKMGHGEKASCLAFKSCRMSTAANCRCTGLQLILILQYEEIWNKTSPSHPAAQSSARGKSPYLLLFSYRTTTVNIQTGHWFCQRKDYCLLQFLLFCRFQFVQFFSRNSDSRLSVVRLSVRL